MVIDSVSFMCSWVILDLLCDSESLNVFFDNSMSAFVCSSSFVRMARSNNNKE